MKRVLTVLAMMALLGTAVLVAVLPRTTLRAKPRGIMGTDTELTVVVSSWRLAEGEQALAAAEGRLRMVEAAMSAQLATSELSALNSAPAGKEVELSEEMRGVLRTARDFHKASGGVFDVTCRPLLDLWKRCGQAKRLPSDQELRQARDRVGWRHFKITDRGAVKLTDGAAIDLGGIAKKYAIDRAGETMMSRRMCGGIVNVGGDMRMFGSPQRHDEWTVGIRDPFDKTGDLLATIRFRQGAVCTSGNYERFVEIDDRRYSHIVDPRTGWTADAVPSVTVYGPTAVDAGLWATSLVILGPDGIERMPKDKGLEVFMVVGTREDHRYVMTEGFPKLFETPPAKACTTAPETRQATAPGSRPGS